MRTHHTARWPMLHRSRRFARIPAVTLVALLQLFTACSDRQVAGPRVTPVLTGRVLSCAVDVAARTLSCTAPPPSSVQGGPGITADLGLGDQGTYVALRSSNVSYNAGTSTFQADVTVQNLTAVPMGTPDGSTVTGVKVFFHSGPTVTSGTGTVTVANADGTGTFTGTNQPYFLYNQILQTSEVSATKPWQWNVPATVNTFVFQVLVDGAAPQEQTVLRWTAEVGYGYFRGVWGSASNDVFAVMEQGEMSIWHYDGTRWSSQAGGPGQTVRAVWGSGPKDVFAVGNNGINGVGLILHYDGVSWSAQTSPTGPTLYSIWGSGATDVFAVGISGTILHNDGTGWTAQESGTGEL